MTAVAMESTGMYWKPIFNILEDGFDVVLANAQHIKNVPGRKTDIKDCQWIARLFRNGLISGSFIPPRDIRELRDLTRTRRKLVEEMALEKNRVQKVLEEQIETFDDAIRKKAEPLRDEIQGYSIGYGG
ncbi:MAG: transposase [Euryarchaeota archaeon]|nr:transposase [Euryarchaeota archaeon]